MYCTARLYSNREMCCTPRLYSNIEMYSIGRLYSNREMYGTPRLYSNRVMYFTFGLYNDSHSIKLRLRNPILKHNECLGPLPDSYPVSQALQQKATFQSSNTV